MTRTIHQRQGREEYWIEVGEKGISYRSRIAGNDGRATVAFELLSRNTKTQRRSNPFFRNASLYFAILTVLTVAFGFLLEVDVRVSLIWAALSAACYVGFRIGGASYEVFPLTDGRVFRVMKNRPRKSEYEEFRRELFASRDRYLRDRYAKINVDRPAPLERRRIEWLHNEGVLEDDAFATIVETIDEQALQ